MALLSVIIPAYNEELNIAHTTEVLSSILQREKIAYELLFVSDGSADKTFALIEGEAARDSRVRGLQFSRNFGKEAAIFAGLEFARGDCCVVIDCDLQHPPETIPKMYRLWEQGYQIVEGVKANRGKEKLSYKLSAGLFYRLLSKLTKVEMADTSDFKLLDRKVVEVLNALPERNTFFRALSFWTGFRSIAVEYEVAERAYGSSKWSMKGLMKYAVSNITAFSSAPLQLVTGLGVLLLAITVVLGIQTLVRYFLHRAVEGFTTVILLVLLIGGVLMMSLGIIGYYIAKIYEEVKGRPRYIVGQMTDNLYRPDEKEKKEEEDE